MKVMIGYKCSTTRTTMNYCAQILNINLYKDNKQLCDYNSKLNMWAREARKFFAFITGFTANEGELVVTFGRPSINFLEPSKKGEGRQSAPPRIRA